MMGGARDPYSRNEQNPDIRNLDVWRFAWLGTGD